MKKLQIIRRSPVPKPIDRSVDRNATEEGARSLSSHHPYGSDRSPQESFVTEAWRKGKQIDRMFSSTLKRAQATGTELRTKYGSPLVTVVRKTVTQVVEVSRE